METDTIALLRTRNQQIERLRRELRTLDSALQEQAAEIERLRQWLSCVLDEIFPMTKG